MALNQDKAKQEASARFRKEVFVSTSHALAPGILWKVVAVLKCPTKAAYSSFLVVRTAEKIFLSRYVRIPISRNFNFSRSLGNMSRLKELGDRNTIQGLGSHHFVDLARAEPVGNVQIGEPRLVVPMFRIMILTIWEGDLVFQGKCVASPSKSSPLQGPNRWTRER